MMTGVLAAKASCFRKRHFNYQPFSHASFVYKSSNSSSLVSQQAMFSEGRDEGEEVLVQLQQIFSREDRDGLTILNPII